MNKLVLKIDDLRVESFATDGARDVPRGTVRAHVEGGSDGSDPISVHVTYVTCVEEGCGDGATADGYSCWSPDCTLWITCYDEA